MAKYNESLDIKSDSLEKGGEGIQKVVTNDDPREETGKKAPAPVFDEPRSESSISPIRTYASDVEEVTGRSDTSLASSYLKEREGAAQTKKPQPEPKPEPTPQATPPPNKAEPSATRPEPRKPEPDRATRPKPAQPKRTSGFGAPHPQHKPKEKAKPRPEPSQRSREHNPFNTAVVVVAMLFFAGSAYLLLPFIGVDVPRPSLSALPFAGSAESEEPGVEGAILPESLVSVSEIETIPTGEMDAGAITQEVNSLRAGSGSSTAIFLTVTESSGESDGELATQERAVTANELFNMLSFRTDAILPRTIEAYTFGTLGDETFLVARVRSYDEALGALYSWEEDMPRNLRGLFQVDSRATRSQENAFEDVVVSGVDARALFAESTSTDTRENEDSETTETTERTELLTYAFPDKQTLVITSSFEALEEIFNLLIE